MNVPGGAGLNRVVLGSARYADQGGADANQPDVRPRAAARRRRHGARRPAAAAADGILAPPGTYTVKLAIGGREFTQPLTVRKDPHSGGTEADIQAQMTVLTELRDGVNTTVDAINQLEYVRAQVQTTHALAAGRRRRSRPRPSWTGKLEELEMNLDRSPHHRRTGRRALRREAAGTLQLPGQRHRRAATSGPPISTSRPPSSCRSG